MADRRVKVWRNHLGWRWHCRYCCALRPCGGEIVTTPMSWRAALAGALQHCKETARQEALAALRADYYVVPKDRLAGELTRVVAAALSPTPDADYLMDAEFHARVYHVVRAVIHELEKEKGEG